MGDMVQIIEKIDATLIIHTEKAGELLKVLKPDNLHTSPKLKIIDLAEDGRYHVFIEIKDGSIGTLKNTINDLLRCIRAVSYILTLNEHE